MDERWRYYMTEEDHDLVTSLMTPQNKKKFDSCFDETNHLMSLGAFGLIKTVNENLDPKQVSERRKRIPEFLHRIKMQNQIA